MSNIIIALVREEMLSREELESLQGKLRFGDNIGFNYTWKSKPSENIMKHVIESRDIDAYGEEGLSDALKRYVSVKMKSVTVGIEVDMDALMSECIMKGAIRKEK